MKLKEVSQWLNEELTRAYDDDREKENIIAWLIEHHLNLKGTDLITQKELTVNDEKLYKIKQSLSRLKSFEPIQYVTGKTWFFDLELTVNDAVLIPRPETEELTEKIIDLKLSGNAKVLDIGTGSGCIPLALKSKMPDWEITGTDISEKALKIAKHNRDKYNLNVTFIQWDIRKNHELENEKFDVIISNPPYVPESENKMLHPRVKKFEPSEALFSQGSDPLFFYKLIAEKGRKMLKNSGIIALETHFEYAKAVAEFFEITGFRNIEIRKDLSGKNRFVFAYLQ